jgi:hypothetical protein
LPAIAIIPILVSVLTIGGRPAPRTFDDEMIRLELDSAWRIEGESGEYFLESDDQDIASMMILPPDSERTMEERLADIEEQFLGTGIIEIEISETRTRDDEEISYRRYRLMMAGSEAEESNWIYLHQYSFWRADVQVLVQVETIPGRESHQELFDRIFDTLEVYQAPEPYLFEDLIFNGDEEESE